MIGRFIKQELRHGFYSNNFLWVAILLIALLCATIILCYSSVQNNYYQYQNVRNFYEANDIDIKKELTEGYEIGSDGVIKNPISYHTEMVAQSLYSASPEYILSQLLEYSLLLFPLPFSLLGLLIASGDYRHRTIKLKTIRCNKVSLAVAKQLVFLIAGLIIMLLALFIAFAIGCIVYNVLLAKVPVEAFPFIPQSLGVSMLVKLLFGYLVAIIYSELGFALGLIFKNATPGILIIAVYSFVLPILGRLDLKNVFQSFALNIFDFQGIISISEVKEVSLISGVVVIVTVMICSVGSSLLVIKNRSSYSC